MCRCRCRCRCFCSFSNMLNIFGYKFLYIQELLSFLYLVLALIVVVALIMVVAIAPFGVHISCNYLQSVRRIQYRTLPNPCTRFLLPFPSPLHLRFPPLSPPPPLSPLVPTSFPSSVVTPTRHPAHFSSWPCRLIFVFPAPPSVL